MSLEKCEQEYLEHVSQYLPFPLSKNATIKFTSLDACIQGSLRHVSYYALPTIQDQDNFSKPMPWIGIYIAVASLVCTLGMAADLIHGLRHRKFGFPCKYFTLNAASLTVMAVAMKLPVDLSNPMPGSVDKAAKFSSFLFMCTIVTNFMPSLATMDNRDLFMNIIALDILVITVLVNVCIEAVTGIIGFSLSIIVLFAPLIFFVLMASNSLALAIPTSKSILELKYQAMHKTILDDQESQQTKFPTFNTLKRHVSKFWVMSGTGSPQIVAACSPACSASGVVCAILALILLPYSVITSLKAGRSGCHSDYKWTTLLILVVQSIGIVVGTIAPLSRCFVALNFNLSLKWSKKHIQFFKIESYWSHTLVDWKRSRVPLHIGSRRCKVLVHYVKSIILSFCIGLQKVIVATCKMIRLILVLCVIFFQCFCCCCFCCCKFSSSRNAQTRTDLQKCNANQDLSHYVLQLEDGVKFSERTLNQISSYVECLIEKAEKQQPNNLMELLEISTEFTGVDTFDDSDVDSLLSEEPPNSWSLPVVTLTSIAIAIPNIQNTVVDSLLRSVKEGLKFVSLVEETLNGEKHFVDILSAANKLWVEVDFQRTWLTNNLQKVKKEGRTSEMILQSLSNKAQKIVIEFTRRTNGDQETEVISHDMFIAANSMYRTTQSILLYYEGRLEETSEELLFVQVSSMIADILRACLTNLPRAISMKCYASPVEKREESVKIAAQILGQTKKIIDMLPNYELPSLDPDQMASIDKWRDFLKQPIA